MKITATPCKASELKPGELFSSVGPFYWSGDALRDQSVVGEKVYIRTDTPCPPGEEERETYRIEIEGGPDSPLGVQARAMLTENTIAREALRAIAERCEPPRGRVSREGARFAAMTARNALARMGVAP